MRVLLKAGLIVLIAEADDEAHDLAVWKSQYGGHVLHARVNDPAEVRSLTLHDLGSRMEACREPINVVSNSSNPIARTISNLAETPFVLDGEHYRAVESFWQQLKFTDPAHRSRVARMEGPEARGEGARQGYPDTISYGGRQIIPGTWNHWQLMEQACLAKFSQNAEARKALLATGDRPLIHVVRRDSRTIPGVVMAAIWMRIRKRLHNGRPAPVGIGH